MVAGVGQEEGGLPYPVASIILKLEFNLMPFIVEFLKLQPSSMFYRLPLSIQTFPVLFPPETHNNLLLI